MSNPPPYPPASSATAGSAPPYPGQPPFPGIVGQQPSAPQPSQPLYPGIVYNQGNAPIYAIPDQSRANNQPYPPQPAAPTAAAAAPYPPQPNPYLPPSHSDPQPNTNPYGAASIPSGLQGLASGPYPPPQTSFPGVVQPGYGMGQGGNQYGQIPTGQVGGYAQQVPVGGMGLHPSQTAAAQVGARQLPGGYQVQPRGGRKKALLIGCNYPGTSAELKGCVNDAKCMQFLLTTKFGYQEHNVRLMTDNQAGPLRPTKQNIFESFRWLVEGAQPGDCLFFHFSGHGSQKRDYTGDERDGYNETLLPTDHHIAGQIVDDDVNKYLVNSLGPGVRLHAVIDACHSGTAMDLQYNTKARNGMWVWKDNGPTRKFKGTRGGIAFQFGACKDSQVAQDTADLSGSAHTGAATFSFIEAIEKGGPNQSYAQVLSHMHRSLEKLNSGGEVSAGGGGLTGQLVGLLLNSAAKVMGVGKQTPQLSCTEQLDLNTGLLV